MKKFQENGSITSPAGFRAAAVAAGIKQLDRLDLTLIYSDRDCSAAAVFTQNQVVAAPVIVDRETIRQNPNRIRGIIANAGVANACTGKLGLINAREMQRLAATAFGYDPAQILVLSTGVIGAQLPLEKIHLAIEEAVPNLSPENGSFAAEAIMTTDTHPKSLAMPVDLPGGTVTIGGMAKGAGMIHPNMATMLAVLTTDVQIAPERLDGLLRTAVNASFNRISVDGDTSTNDTVLLLANGASGLAIEDNDQESLVVLGQALNHICTELAHMIVRDGEGATKFVTINVTGAATDEEAHTVANTIATSPLVKTAFAGSDANWGRILAAAGRAGVHFDPQKINLWVGNQRDDALQLVAFGARADYEEADAAAIFAKPDILVRLDLGVGNGNATVWTTDLTHGYVSINADYRS